MRGSLTFCSKLERYGARPEPRHAGKQSYGEKGERQRGKLLGVQPEVREAHLNETEGERSTQAGSSSDKPGNPPLRRQHVVEEQYNGARLRGRQGHRRGKPQPWKLQQREMRRKAFSQRHKPGHSARTSQGPCGVLAEDGKMYDECQSTWPATEQPKGEPPTLSLGERVCRSLSLSLSLSLSRALADTLEYGLAEKRLEQLLGGDACSELQLCKIKLQSLPAATRSVGTEAKASGPRRHRHKRDHLGSMLPNPNRHYFPPFADSSWSHSLATAPSQYSRKTRLHVMLPLWELYGEMLTCPQLIALKLRGTVGFSIFHVSYVAAQLDTVSAIHLSVHPRGW